MKATHFLAWFLLLLSHGFGVALASEDPCASPDINDTRIHLSLSRAYQSRNGFIGVFELENRSFAAGLRVPGFRANGTFFVRKPELWVEYKDLSGLWQPLPDIVRDNINTEVLEIPSKSKAQFSAYVVTQEFATLQVADFRVLLRLPSSSLCIRSTPFRSVPSRKKVDGLEGSSKSQP